MSLKHLRTLIAIAENRTFGRAAQAVSLTHAAVSQHMSALEAEMGVPLFDRSRRTPQLNAAGRELVDRARDLLRDYDSLRAALQGQDALNGEFSLGAVPTTLGGLAPQAIGTLKAAWPGLGLALRPGLTSALLTALARHQLDGALVTRPQIMPSWVSFRSIAQEPLMLITSASVAGDDPAELLMARPFIRFSRDAIVGTQIEHWIQSRGLRPAEAMELETLDAIGAMVHADLGVSIVPRPCVMPSNQYPLRWIPLGDPGPERELGLAFHADSPKATVIDEVHAACVAATTAAQQGGA